MTETLLLCLGLTVILYFTIYFLLPYWAQCVLIRHPLGFICFEFIVTIPFMTALFGPGMMAGTINLATSAIFGCFLKVYGKWHPEMKLTRKQRKELMNG